MITPAIVQRLEARAKRSARIIADRGGIFISLDGDSAEVRALVERALDEGMRRAPREAIKLGPQVTRLGGPALCHGNILGSVERECCDAVCAVLRAAGFEVKS